MSNSGDRIRSSSRLLYDGADNDSDNGKVKRNRKLLLNESGMELGEPISLRDVCLFLAWFLLFILLLVGVVVVVQLYQNTVNSAAIAESKRYQNCLPLEADHVFDWIIVGGGSGGCAAAERLSSVLSNRVLLVDIGSNRTTDPDIRNGYGANAIQAFRRPELLYRYPVVQPFDVPVKFDYLTGFTLGGGSSVNGEQFVRPSNATLKEWSAINGNTPLWDEIAVNGYYVIFENYNGATTNPSVRGTTGPNDVRQSSPSGSAAKFVQAVANALGYPAILDYNDTPHGPFTRWQLSQQPDGKRESSDTAFLNANTMARKNLRVLTKTRALRIIWQEGASNNRADGVLLSAADGSCRYARVRKGVVSAAGIGTPLFLQYSGIGNASHLASVGVKPVVDLPVGKQMKNHLGISTFFLRNSSDALAPTPDDIYAAGAFLRAPGQGPNANFPREWQYLTIDAGPTGLVVAPIHLRPVGVGSVEIVSNDPLSIPRVTEAGFDHPADAQAFVDMIQQQLVPIAAALNTIDPNYVMVSPPSSILSNASSLLQFVKSTVIQAYHYQNTCRMAPRNDGGVVDVNAKVYDTENVYVGDVTLMPVSNDGNTDAPARIIGFMVGDRLKSL